MTRVPDEIAELQAALIRLEVAQAKTKKEVDEIRSDTLKVKRDVSEIQATIQAFSTIGDDLKKLSKLKPLVLRFGWTAVVAIGGFVALVYSLRDRADATDEKMDTLKGKQEYHERVLQRIDVNVLELGVEMREWKRGAEKTERRIERLEDRR